MIVGRKIIKIEQSRANSNKYLLSFNILMKAGSVWFSPSVLSLLISNIVVLFLAIFFNWSFVLLLLSYFGQTVIVAVFFDIKTYFFNKNFIFAGKKDLAKLNPEWVKVQSVVKNKNKIVNEAIKRDVLGDQSVFSIFAQATSVFVLCIIFLIAILWLYQVALQYNFIIFESDVVFFSFVFSLFVFFINHLYSFILYFKSEKQTYAGEQAKLLGRVGALFSVFVVGIMIWSVAFWAGIILNPVLIVVFSLVKTAYDAKAHLAEHAAELDALRY